MVEQRSIFDMELEIWDEEVRCVKHPPYISIYISICIILNIEKAAIFVSLLFAGMNISTWIYVYILAFIYQKRKF